MLVFQQRMLMAIYPFKLMNFQALLLNPLMEKRTQDSRGAKNIMHMGQYTVLYITFPACLENIYTHKL